MVQYKSTCNGRKNLVSIAPGIIAKIGSSKRKINSGQVISAVERFIDTFTEEVCPFDFNAP